MNSIKYAYIALICWGFWAIGSKILSKHLNPESISFWLSIWALIPLSIFLVYKKNLVLNQYAFYAIPVGLMSLLAILAFYRALTHGPTSVIVPLTNMYVIFPVLFGFIFLKEAVTLPRILGIIFAVIASVLLSL